VTVGIAALILATPAAAQHQMPPGMTHEQHLQQMQKEAELKQRGAEAMGFDQDAAIHQFRLEPTGGAIEVETRTRDDDTTRLQIRRHLEEIAVAFARGDFSKSIATHAEVPPGVDRMRQLKDAISYRYEETPRGGRVKIVSSDQDAIAAVHEFLKYQIREHRTDHHQE
jgi:Fe2+ transport system protein FeoA